jgi:hypothetical protein
MKAILAEQLLAKIMEWSPEEVSKERSLLQAMANLKYDEYHQFSPGIRFIESLAQWLGQFEMLEEKKTMYVFLKKYLIFISSDQMSHLVDLSFSTIINPIIIKKVASILNIQEYLINKIISSSEYKNISRQSLFIGLSDGSRIDQLRRRASLDNEQVLTTYYIDDEKTKDMISELQKTTPNEKYTSVFLVDDFTASGTSYARYDGGIAKGKVLKLLSKIFTPDDEKNNTKQIHFSDLVETKGLTIHLIFYIATETALENISKTIEEWKDKNDKKELKYTIQAVQTINNQARQILLEDANLIDIIKTEKYFDETIIDRHYRMGDVKTPYLGFSGCGLPLVLFHNTPNNSLPIIWFSEDQKIKGLFPRITRHKE